jgi:hypothetical protein
MIGIVSNFFEVIVFTADTEAFLCIGDAWVGDRCVTKDYVFKPVHASVSKHESGIAFNDERCGCDDAMIFVFEEVEEC